MFHPAFMDNVVFALEQDGGAECLLMIDEVNQKDFSPKTLSELNNYLNRKEQLLLEKERHQRKVEETRQQSEKKEKSLPISPIIESFEVSEEQARGSHKCIHVRWKTRNTTRCELIMNLPNGKDKEYDLDTEGEHDFILDSSSSGIVKVKIVAYYHSESITEYRYTHYTASSDDRFGPIVELIVGLLIGYLILASVLYFCGIQLWPFR